MFNEAKMPTTNSGKIFDSVVFYDAHHHNPEDYQIGLIGLDKQLLIAFREAFYNLGDHFPFSILDFGLLDDDKSSSTLKELAEKIPLIIIGGKEISPLSPNVVISNRFIETKEFGSAKYIGYQRHRISIGDFNMTDEFQNISLGELRKYLGSVEPLMRPCKGMLFRLDTIRQSDLGISANNICGLTLEEGAQICRYGGLSTDMRWIQFPSMTPKFTYGNISDEFSEACATLCWYYLEGFLHKTYEATDSHKHLSYVINSHVLEEDITFIKTEKTGRWWMKYGDSADYVPCLYEDFVQSREGNIPDRLMKYCLEG